MLRIQTYAILLCVAVLPACAPYHPLLDLGRAEIAYPKQIPQENYLYLVTGFYVNKDLSVDDHKITYEVLWDNTQRKREIEQAFATSEKFQKNYPAFVGHQGETDCKANQFVLTKYDVNLKPIGHKDKTGMTDAAQKLCYMLDLYESTDKK